MATIDLGDDDGFVDVTIEGAKNRLDVYAVQNKIHALAQANLDNDPAFQHSVAEYLAEIGFPSGLSNRAASRFIAFIADAMKELEKKGDPVSA